MRGDLYSRAIAHLHAFQLVSDSLSLALLTEKARRSKLNQTIKPPSTTTSRNTRTQQHYDLVFAKQSCTKQFSRYVCGTLKGQEVCGTKLLLNIREARLELTDH